MMKNLFVERWRGSEIDKTAPHPARELQRAEEPTPGPSKEGSSESAIPLLGGARGGFRLSRFMGKPASCTFGVE